MPLIEHSGRMPVLPVPTGSGTCNLNIRLGSLMSLIFIASSSNCDSELPSMFLVLILVYFFHASQSQTAPLASLLAESGNSTITTVLSTPTCICPADKRSIWDILWSCLATIFACSWVSVHPNIPAPDESSWRIFLRRLELMFWAVIGPSWAFRQCTLKDSMIHVKHDGTDYLFAKCTG